MDQLQKDLSFCIEECGMNDEQIEYFTKAAESLGVTCEYLAEEFVFESDTYEEFERLHLDPDYLKIDWKLN